MSIAPPQYKVTQNEFHLLVAYARGELINDKYLTKDAHLVYTTMSDYYTRYKSHLPEQYLTDWCGKPIPIQLPAKPFMDEQIKRDWLTLVLQDRCDIIAGEAAQDPHKAWGKLNEEILSIAKELDFGGTEIVHRFSDYRERLKRIQEGNVDPIFTQLSSFGLPLMDKETYGICAGDLVIIAAKTNEGKSWLGKRITLTSAVDHHQRVLVLPFEEDLSVAIHRFDALYGNVPSIDYMRGFLDPSSLTRIQQRFDQLQLRGDIIIPEEGIGLRKGSVPDILKLIRKYEANIVVIDQLSLFSKSLNWEDFATLTRDIKLANVMTNTATIAMTQASKFAKPIIEVGTECISNSEEIARNADSIIYGAPDSESRDPKVKYLKLLKTRRGAKSIITRNLWDLDVSRIEELGIYDEEELEREASAPTRHNYTTQEYKSDTKEVVTTWDWNRA